MSDENLLIGQQERKARLKDIFEDTLLLLKQDEQLSADTKKAMSEAEFYPHDSNLSFANEKHKTHISATNERTFEAARRLLSEKDGKVAVGHCAASIDLWDCVTKYDYNLVPGKTYTLKVMPVNGEGVPGKVKTVKFKYVEKATNAAVEIINAPAAIPAAKGISSFFCSSA